ncbi:MAG: hypothetical protein HY906_01230 [Deltaproteobacteria bacterium]|nr:hypothetical protein [Deltaproteobacteria bacterium]
MVQPPPAYEPPTVVASRPFKRKRTYSFIAAGAAGFFAKKLDTSLPGLATSDAITKVIGVDASVGFTLAQINPRLALQLALEMGLMFDPSTSKGNYLAAPMAMNLGLRFDLTSGVALDVRVGGGGVVSAVETTDGSAGSRTKMHPVGQVSLNWFFIDLLHLGFDTWIGKDNTLAVLKFGIGF